MRKAALLPLALLLAGCTDGGDPTGLRPTANRVPDRAGNGRPSFMTWNLYVGADIDRMLGAPPAMIPVVAAELWAEVQATNFEERAAAIAAEVARRQPHLIGLQEVSTFHTQSPGDVLIGNPVAAPDLALDFLAVLMRALAAQGLDYRVAAVTLNHDLEVPMLTGAGLDDIRLTDHDVILARDGVAIDGAQTRNFSLNLVVPLPTGSLTIRRGWAAVEARIGNRGLRFVTTHLEPSEYAPQIQEAQAAELITALAADPVPTVITGDLNSAADGSSTASYARFLAAGFVDGWTIGVPNRAGFTCCHPKTLLGDDEQLVKRIDYVLLRGFGLERRGSTGGVDAVVLGDQWKDRTPSGLWPSDHAGVFVRLHPPVSTPD